MQASFLAISAIVIVTPGPDTVLTIRNTLLGGRRGGSFTALGVALGQAVWALATSVGLATVLAASEPAFLALRVFGAGYLVYLGAHALLAAIRPRNDVMSETDGVTRRYSLGRWSAFAQGLMSNLGNPKMAVFFVSLFPQFTPHNASFGSVLALGFVFCAMTLSWLTMYAFVVEKAGDVLRRTQIRCAVDAIAGAALIALGARLATESR